MGKFSPETIEKMRQAKLRNPTKYWLGKKRPELSGELHPHFGKPRPKEVRDKISKANFGKTEGPLNGMWKGERVSYRNLHRWVERRIGKPRECSACVVRGEGHRMHWANKSGQYQRSLSDWIRLCPQCHGEYDKSKGLRKNTFTNKLQLYS